MGRAEALAQLFERVFNILFIGDVATYRNTLSACGGNLLGDRAERVRRAGQQSHTGARFREGDRDRFADTTTGARNDHCVVV